MLRRWRLPYGTVRLFRTRLGRSRCSSVATEIRRRGAWNNDTRLRSSSARRVSSPVGRRTTPRRPFTVVNRQFICYGERQWHRHDATPIRAARTGRTGVSAGPPSRCPPLYPGDTARRLHRLASAPTGIAAGIGRRSCRYAGSCPCTRRPDWQHRDGSVGARRN